MKLRTWLIAGAAVAAMLLFGAFLTARARLRQWSYPNAPRMPPEVVESMEDVLSRLEAALTRSSPETLAALQPGLSESRIADLEKEGGFQLSPDLRVLYQWRNGTRADSPADFIPRHRFPSLEQVIEERRAMSHQLKEATALQRAAHRVLAGHRATWIPVLDDGAGDGYFFDPSRSPAEGAVFFNFAETGDYVFFPNAKNLLTGIAECFERGVYAASANGDLVEKYEESPSVWKKYGATISP